MGASAGSIFVDLLLRDASYRGGLNRARGDTRNFATGAAKDLAATKRAFLDVINPVNNVSSAIKSLGISIAGFLSAQKIVQLSDSYRSLSGRLGLVVEDSRQLSEVQDELYQIALRTRQPLEGVYNLYTRIAQAIPESERGQYNLLEITESINQALAITGEGSAQAASAILQFTQAAASGFEASSQEINSLLDSAPRLAKALQNAFGDGSKSLKQLSKDGELDLDTILRALEKVSGEGQKLSEEFGKTELTVGQSLTNLETAFMQFLGTNELARTATAGLANLINNLALGFGGLDEKIQNATHALENYFGVSKGYTEITPEMFNRALPPEYTEYSDGEMQAALDRAKAGSKPKKLSDSEIKKAKDEAARAEKALGDLYKKNATYISGMDKETLQYIDTEKELNELYKKGKINVNELYTALSNLDAEYDELDKSTEEFGFNLEEFGKEASRNLQNAFKDFFKNTDDGFDGLVEGFADALAEMAANAAATNLANLIFGDGKKSKGLLGSIFDGIGSSSSSSSSGGGFFDDILGSVGGLFDGWFADGGSIKAGHWGMAGENGPEPVFGGMTGATVVPNGAMGSGGNTYYIDAKGADQSAIAALEIKLEALAGKGVIERRVANAQTRGAL